MKKFLKIFLPCCIILIVSALWGFRFYSLNSEVEIPNIEWHSMGESVPYEDDFFHRADESREGYAITVQSATLMSYEEYVKAHGETIDYIGEDQVKPTYVYDLEVNIQNHNTVDDPAKGIDLVNTRLLASNDSMQVNDRLFALVYPKLDGQLGFCLQPNSALTLHLPYVTYEKNTKDKLLKKDWSLLLSLYPTEKRINVEPN